jgi:hypothetical protein
LNLGFADHSLSLPRVGTEEGRKLRGRVGHIDDLDAGGQPEQLSRVTTRGSSPVGISRFQSAMRRLPAAAALDALSFFS